MKQLSERSIIREGIFTNYFCLTAVFLSILLIGLLTDCTKNPGAPDGGYGSIAFSIEWEGEETAKITGSQDAPEGVAIVRVRVGGNITEIVKDFQHVVAENPFFFSAHPRGQ